jgi:uncharacterized protein DUF5343
MAAKFPATTLPNSLRKFLKGVPDRNVPPKVTQQYLSGIGLKSSNDRTIIPVLKFVGMLDGSGAPTESYRQFRNRTGGPIVLAEQIRRAYSQLYDTYENAHSQSDSVLQDFFRANTDVGDRTINLLVATFKALCEFADFGSAVPLAEASVTAGMAKSSHVPGAAGQTPEVHINLQIHLPVSNDPAMYDAIFDATARSLRKLV